MAPYSEKSKAVELPRRKTTAEQLAERMAFRNRNASHTKQAPATEVEEESLDQEIKMEPADHDLDTEIKQEQEEKEKDLEAIKNMIKEVELSLDISKDLKQMLKRLEGRTLLKLTLNLNTEVIACFEGLFERLCRKAEVTEKPDDITWRQKYAKLYFGNRLGDRKEDWENTLQTKNASSIVHVRIRHRAVTTTRTKPIDIPEMFVKRNGRMSDRRLSELAKSRAVRVVRMVNERRAEITEAPKPRPSSEPPLPRNYQWYVDKFLTPHESQLTMAPMLTKLLTDTRKRFKVEF